MAQIADTALDGHLRAAYHPRGDHQPARHCRACAAIRPTAPGSPDHRLRHARQGVVMALLSVQQLVKRYGGLLATDHFDFNVEPGELHAIIGPNGAGKSTLIAQLAGDVRPDPGQLRFLDPDLSRLKRSEEHTSELQSLMRISYAVFCLKKKKTK